MANEEQPHYLSDSAILSTGLGTVLNFFAVGSSTGVGGYDGACRFTNIPINQGENIDFALLVLPYSSVGTSNGDWVYDIFGIDEDNTNAFGDPFTRSKTGAKTSEVTNDPTVGGTREIDVRPMLQEIVNRPGWNPGNSAGFIFEDVSSDDDVFAFFDLTQSYLIYRLQPVPNFKPPTVSIPAPSIPAPESYGIKISKPGVSVLTAPDDDLYLTTRKKQVKIIDDNEVVGAGPGDIVINHGLGYVPMVTVYGKGVGVGSQWVRLPVANFATDDQSYYIDSNNLYLHFSVSGQKAYYRIFLDRIK